MTQQELYIGMKVTYIPNHLNKIKPCRITDLYSGREVGLVTSWNEIFVFVDYGTGTSKATNYNDLLKGDESFYCPDEWDSVLDGAFGRCGSECYNCKKARSKN